MLKLKQLMPCRKDWITKLSLLSAVTLMISSGTTVEYVVQPLDRPSSLTKSELPTEGDLECLSDSAYGKVVNIHKRVLTLESIIDSTH
jgi:hypothetical protein